ncbi:MAG: nicotinate phosphoribosyltransferase [Cyclobacteriaceae bacterium]|nr:nicotinate phosphoribosyltransferase [Cyclobacteriaceae bacterium]
MKITNDLYGGSLALLTDLYQFTMAYAFWKEGRGEEESVFNLFFRKNPFKGGFTITCGLSYVIEFLQQYQFVEEDLAYLRQLKGHDQTPLFEEEFLSYLKNLKFQCQVDAIPEGTVVFPHEPLIRIQGPIIQCQLLESPLLNLINYQSLVATKAARVFEAAKGEMIMEFGLRRAQGIDGALSASRAAYIGGCSSTSNVLAGKLFNIPVAGTHAHSWVMSFDNELEAFHRYAHAMPNNCVFLVDTYDTLQGVRHAIEVGKALREQGKELLGIRIDSGDLAYFSNRARKMLDQAGFQDAKIVASNDLDENIITSLNDQAADIDTWGVGTKLVTAFDQPALGGVYKLSAVRKDEDWNYKLKLSEQAIKVNNPGIQQVRRFTSNGKMVADMIYDLNTELSEDYVLIDPMDVTRRKKITSGVSYRDLLEPIFKDGQLVYHEPDIHEIREKVRNEIAQLDKAVRRFVNPHSYVVGLEKSLHHLKTELILKLRHLK